MSCVDMRTLASCFDLPENTVITSVHPTELTLTIDLACSDPTACCPLYHQHSERVHSRYNRKVADVPCGGRRVFLLLNVRKYICHTGDCSRSIFTERLPELVLPYARMTNRGSCALPGTGGEVKRSDSTSSITVEELNRVLLTQEEVIIPLKALPIPSVPEETARVAHAAFPQGNLFMQVRGILGTIYTDEVFADLFATHGQPALAPWRLALVTIFQFIEGLTDRQAADAVRDRVACKYALSLELCDPSFDHSVLSEFRSRLIEGHAEQRLLDLLLDRCREGQKQFQKARTILPFPGHLSPFPLLTASERRER